jgi:hypothetical protein
VVDDDVGGADRGLQIRAAGEPVTRDEKRELVIVGDSNSDFEKLFSVVEEAVLMRIEMRGAEAHGVGAIDLRAEFEVDFFWVDAGRGRPIVMEIAVFVDEAGDFVFRNDGAPAIVDAFACEREVDAEIGIGMGFCVVGDFRKPRAGDHEAGGIDEAGFESLDGGGVHGMGFAEVVGVDDEKFRIAGEAEFLGERFGVFLRGRGENGGSEGEQKQKNDSLLIHRERKHYHDSRSG